MKILKIAKWKWHPFRRMTLLPFYFREVLYITKTHTSKMSHLKMYTMRLLNNIDKARPQMQH